MKVESAGLSAMMKYGGFWRRVVAKIIDGFIISGLNTVFYAAWKGHNPLTPQTFEATMGIVQFMFQVAYSTWFLEKFWATPGKMVVGLKVVTSKGEEISAMRAFGRSFAEFLSGCILYIGYLMAAFDDEQRTLHDRIAGTRVIRKRWWPWKQGR